MENEIIKPEIKCGFQKIKEIKEYGLGKIKRYEIECNLTVRESSVLAFWIIHISQARRDGCNIENCPIYQTSINNGGVRTQ